MTNKEILKKIIEKATENGFEYGTQKNAMIIPRSFIRKNGLFNILLFNHDFAKAFWGKQRISIQFNFEKGKYYYKFWDEKTGKEHGLKPAWQFFLQEMVLSENPIKFLKQFIK